MKCVRKTNPKRTFHLENKAHGGGEGVYAQIVTDYAQYTDSNTRFKTDAQGAYSVTPLDITQERNRTQLPVCGICTEEAHVIIDATAGIGGDAVSFMLGFQHSTVYALEPDTDRVRILEHNVAAVRKNARVPTGDTHCVQGEFADLFGRLAQLLRACTVLYLDPEWGGPAYHNEAQVHLPLRSHSSAKQRMTQTWWRASRTRYTQFHGCARWC